MKSVDASQETIELLSRGPPSIFVLKGDIAGVGFRFGFGFGLGLELG